MSQFEGFFELRTPADLLEKLRHDFSRIRQNCLDSYAAFDFFVTAEHLLDWKYPDDEEPANREMKKHLRGDEPLLRVTSHLANGAKHFKATAARHKSVGGTHNHTGDFVLDDFDPFDFDTDSLVVELTGDDAIVLGPEITVHDLAGRVLAYWETNLELPDQA
ncbi:MAG TPA: hypothetical protein VK548_28480 [Candidatus Acidoferrum sp.]|nr:hypothetical protein [Candidatus Acidoferrum sp.]